MARTALLAVAAILAASAAAPSVRAAPNALPKLPGDGERGAHAGGEAASKGPEGDGARRGIVQVEQGGRPIALGTVLANDGRVITSLSALGANEAPDIRYADGSVVKTKLGHKDKSWDLALLVPQSGQWKDGLAATTKPPSGELRAFLPKGRGLSPTLLPYKGRVDARSRDGEELRAVHAFELKNAHPVGGAPVLDDAGKVVGVLVHACKGEGADGGAPGAPQAKKAGCSPVFVGAPVYALRGFLMKTPADAVQPQPWLGLGGAPSAAGNVRGVQVMGLAPGSPAEKAGLKTGSDTIVAVDGQPVETPEQLAEVIAKRAIGQEVKLLVFSGGKFREVGVALRAAPKPAQ